MDERVGRRLQRHELTGPGRGLTESPELAAKASPRDAIEESLEAGVIPLRESETESVLGTRGPVRAPDGKVPSEILEREWAGVGTLEEETEAIESQSAGKLTALSPQRKENNNA